MLHRVLMPLRANGDAGMRLSGAFFVPHVHQLSWQRRSTHRPWNAVRSDPILTDVCRHRVVVTNLLSTARHCRAKT